MTGPARTRRLRMFGARLALIGLGVAIGASLLEIAARMLGLAPGIDPIVVDKPWASFVSSSNRTLRYVPMPGRTGINTYGIRDFEYPLEKPDDTFRIVVIGDSIAFGYCNPTEFLPIEKTFAKVLERDLASAPFAGQRRVEVINASVSGYDTLQEVEFLRVKGLAFEPDIVLVAYCLNDSEDSSEELDVFRGKESWHAIGLLGVQGAETLFLKSHLLRAIWYRLLRSRDETTSETPAAGVADRRARGFDQLRALGYEEGFETVVALFPNLYSFQPYQYREEHLETRRVALARSFAVLDLLPAFNRASAGDASRIRGRCTSVHPDEYGHRVAAEAIARFLRQTYP